ncbi:hypothetical protein [Pyxidicoccus xibeiensis]|uniref:hypothetical protein n=1 Tax=Pyxidicoccus xibeiensis TaxID=2906759 RepID=UPI0020A74F82|nr:hypothetical protein [Pyxidicoccus xibeiensis]MCP3139949.1 hypothetical protein [Pyxidicoccus xibeiensis]
MRSVVTASAVLLSLTACGGGERVEGLRLTLGLTTTRARSAVEAQGVRTLLTDEGARASLSGALVTLGSVELFPCEATGWRRLLRELSPVGTAWAHSASSPRRLGTPHVLGLGRADGEVRELGVLRPPPGRYCRARLTFEPADADAQGLDSAAAGAEPVDMVGRSLHLRGTLAAEDGSDARPFEVESSGRASVDVVMDGLTLSEETPEATLVFSLAWDTWLDGVSPQEAPTRVDLLGNVARSASLRPAAAP